MATKIKCLIMYLFVSSVILLSVSISESQTSPRDWERNPRILVESTNPDYFILHNVLGVAIAPNGMYGIIYADNRFQLPSMYSEDLFLQIFGGDGEPVGDAINILPPPYGLRPDSPLDIELFADNGGFYVISHTGGLIIVKVDFQGNFLYRTVHHMYWLGGASASIGPEGKINLISVFWNSTSTVYNLAYYQFNKDTGEIIRQETIIPIPGRNPTDGIWNIKLAVDPQNGNNYVLYVKRKHIDRDIKLHLLKFDRNGNVLYDREVDSQWYTTAESVALDYTNGKIHLVWEALNPEFPYNDIVYYGQFYAATGNPVFPSIAVTDRYARNFGVVMAVNGDKINIAYMKSSNSIYILDIDLYYVQLNANDGSMRIPPTKLNPQYLRDVKAVAIASNDIKTHIAWVTWGTLADPSHKLIENVYWSPCRQLQCIPE